MFRINQALPIAMAGVLSLGMIAPSQAAEADFYKGQTITYVVATSPGGGYDRYGRLVAEFMQKKIPGATIVVKNVPGAAHIIGANFIYNSKPDGLTIGTFNTGLTLEQATKADGIKFNLDRMSWIGKAASDPRVLLLSAKTPEIKTIDDLRKAGEPIKVSVNGTDDPEVKILEKAMKLNVRLLAGYTGGADEMAMRRGEIDATFGGHSAFESFVANGYGRYLFAVGGQVEGVPQLRDLEKNPTAENTILIALLQAQGDIARLTAGPPDIPKGRLEVLRAAYKKTFEDAEFIGRAKKSKMPLNPAYGDDVAKMVHDALNMPPATAEMLIKLVRSN